MSKKILVICSFYTIFRALDLGFCTSLIYLSGYDKMVVRRVVVTNVNIILGVSEYG